MNAILSPPRKPSRTMPSKREDVDWQAMTLANAVREASRLLGNERSPIKVIRFLEERGLKISGPQASKVLKDLYRPKGQVPAADPNLLRSSIVLVAAVQAFANRFPGGLPRLQERVREAEEIVRFANTVGGLSNLRVVVEELLAPPPETPDETD